MIILSFREFIAENEKTDPGLEKKVKDELNKDDGTCPRCGKIETECICPDRDYMSTINIYRLRKGDHKTLDNKFKN